MQSCVHLVTICNIFMMVLCLASNTDAKMSAELQREIRKLIHMVNGMCDIGKTFYDCLVTMTYENLSKVQQEVYNQVMRIIPQIMLYFDSREQNLA